MENCYALSGLAFAKHVVELEARALHMFAARLDSQYEKALELLSTTVDRGGKIVVLGIGKSGAIGTKIAATLRSTGTVAVLLDAVNALHGDLGMLTHKDAILALSYSGQTTELLAAVSAATRLQLPVVALTGDTSSSLAAMAEVTIDVSVVEEACPFGLTPTTSAITMLAAGDAIALSLMTLRGVERQTIADLHPGGTLCRAMLMCAADIMRSAETMATVTPQCSVLLAIQEMALRRTGAAVVIFPDGRLAGIYTHGDCARHIALTPHILFTSVGEVMTRAPVTVSRHATVEEVIACIRNNRIDDLIVTDDNHCPIGVIDSQDLARLRLT